MWLPRAKFKLNNDLSCPDKKKNGRNLQTVCMFCGITSLLVKVRKSLHMAFEDDTSVENMRPFLRFYRSQNQSQILFEFGPFQGIFCMGENFEANFFFARALDQKVCIWLWPCAAWDDFMPSFEWNWWFKVVAKCNFRFLHYSSVLLRSFAKSCMTMTRARFEIPARVKADPILNNYLTRTMENNARSGVIRYLHIPIILCVVGG